MIRAPNVVQHRRSHPPAGRTCAILRVWMRHSLPKGNVAGKGSHLRAKRAQGIAPRMQRHTLTARTPGHDPQEEPSWKLWKALAAQSMPPPTKKRRISSCSTSADSRSSPNISSSARAPTRARSTPSPRRWMNRSAKTAMSGCIARAALNQAGCCSTSVMSSATFLGRWSANITSLNACGALRRASCTWSRGGCVARSTTISTHHGDRG